MGKKNSRQRRNGNVKKANGHHNRIDSAVAALQQSGPISKEQWVKKADQHYAKHGGPSNIKESAWAIRHTFAVLRALNLIEDKDGVIALKK
jgi:hypothetical protein